VLDDWVSLYEQKWVNLSERQGSIKDYLIGIYLKQKNWPGTKNVSQIISPLTVPPLKYGSMVLTWGTRFIIFTGRILPHYFPVMPTVMAQWGIFTWIPLLMKMECTPSSGRSLIVPETPMALAAGILSSGIQVTDDR
jgi:hypothetical protein